MADAGRVVRVELFEDRAAVTREVAVAEGRQQLRIGPLTPLVSERALSFPGGADVVVEEARVERIGSTRTEADPATLRDLERRVREAEEAVGEARDAQKRSAGRLERAQALVETALVATPRALVELEPPEAWVEQVRELIARTTTAREEDVAARQAVQERAAERDKLRADLEAGRAGKPTVQGFLVVSVVAARAGSFSVRYTVPCAVWRPAHRAVLDGDQVRWEVRGICWNATGEDWSGVQLSCSTARPGDRAEAPTLTDDVLRTRRRPTEVVVEAREETVQVARERGTRAAREVPGVDDGGEPRTWLAPQPVDLASDGCPVVVTLEAWSTEARSRWVAMPERAAVAVRRTLQRNTGTRPLLAGPVELVAEAAGATVAIGRGRIDLVPPGEPFPLGWGSHDGLRLSRRVEHESSTAMITGRQRRETTVTVRVAHLGDEPCRLEIRERIPTSELKEVTVGSVRAEPALDAPMDGDGFCRWSLELAPGDIRKLELRYAIDAASNVRLPT